jgi:hypothetical protein
LKRFLIVGPPEERGSMIRKTSRRSVSFLIVSLLVTNNGSG